MAVFRVESQLSQAMIGISIYGKRHREETVRWEVSAQSI